MSLPSVSPADVAAYAPDAPAVTQATVDESADWIQGEVDRALPVFVAPDASTRQGRELKRAICAYALYLQARRKASTSRVTSGSAGVTKALTIGRLKIDQAVVDTEQSATGMVTSSAEWLAATWRHLVSAGLPRPRLVAGASL